MFSAKSGFFDCSGRRFSTESGRADGEDDLKGSETARWDEMSRKMFVPFHGDGIISQCEGYEKLAELDLRLLLCPGSGLEVDRSPGQRIDARVHGRAERPAG